jgi:ABC-type sugar transport system ATPase subunit
MSSGVSPMSPSPESAVAPPLVELRDISKHYGPLQALRSVSFSLRKGEIVGLVGDNGAGKSTIVKMLSGVISPSGGSVLLDGNEVNLGSPLEAIGAGIETVYQDLALAPDLSVWANFFLGRELRQRGPGRFVGALNKKAMIAQTTDHLTKLQIKISDVRTKCGDLSGGQRQAVAVGRAVSWETKVLLMDEPTAALGISQRDRVAELARQAADRGLAVMIISHDLPWVRDLCDRVLVLYQGRITAALPREKTTVEEMVTYITGAAGARYEPR